MSFVGWAFHFVAFVIDVLASVVDVDACVVVVVVVVVGPFVVVASVVDVDTCVVVDQSFAAVTSVVIFFSDDAVYKSAVNKSISQANESCAKKLGSWSLLYKR